MEIVIINDDKNDIDNNMNHHPYNNSWAYRSSLYHEENACLACDGNPSNNFVV